MRQKRRRPPNAAQRRAVESISMMHASVPTSRVPQFPGTFTLKRDAELESECDSALDDILSEYGVARVRRLRASIISPRHGAKIVNSVEQSGRKFDIGVLRQMCSTDFPSPINAEIACISIVGAKPGQQGYRYIAAMLDQDATREMRHERGRALYKLGVEDPYPWLIRPHVSLGLSLDQVAAKAALDALQGNPLFTDAAIELEPASVQRTQQGINVF